MRLSRDDGLQGESNSITNQRKLLKKVAAELGYVKAIEYVDDGISGTTFKRPGLMQMERDIEDGLVGVVIVKDMSRLGRNYIKVGIFTDIFLPEHNVRFVAVHDGIDSDMGDDEFSPIRNVFNEQYARNASKKARNSCRERGMAGIPLGHPPYGYNRDPEDKSRWVIDAEAASVVRQIFAWTLEGKGTDWIAGELFRTRTMTPKHYSISKGIGRGGRTSTDNPYQWGHSTIVSILTKREYCGDVINFKTSSLSFRDKRRRKSPASEQMVFEGVHEPIVSREDFARAQEKRKQVKRRPARSKRNLFSGLLRCADCGTVLGFHFNTTNPEITYYNCQNNNSRHGTCPSTHYIRADFLEKVVLKDIQRLIRFAQADEEKFARTVMDSVGSDILQTQEIRQGKLNALLKRDKELDSLFKCVYEDHALGKISESRMRKLAGEYEGEQASVAEQIHSLREESRRATDMSDSTRRFIELVRKHMNIKWLSSSILHQFIDFIKVYQAEKVDGCWVQQIDIHYNCVGEINLPDKAETPTKQVAMTTRKGVTISHAQSARKAS
jgi:DNA invertase Pin-like site-specific DNA recombinase